MQCFNTMYDLLSIKSRFLNWILTFVPYRKIQIYYVNIAAASTRFSERITDVWLHKRGETIKNNRDTIHNWEAPWYLRMIPTAQRTSNQCPKTLSLKRSNKSCTNCTPHKSIWHTTFRSRASDHKDPNNYHACKDYWLIRKWVRTWRYCALISNFVKTLQCKPFVKTLPMRSLSKPTMTTSFRPIRLKFVLSYVLVFHIDVVHLWRILWIKTSWNITSSRFWC